MREIKYQQRSDSEQEDSSSEQSSQEEQQEEELMNAEIERIQQQLKNMPYELILKQKQMGQKHQKNNKKEGATPKIKKLAKKKHIQKANHEKNEAVEVSIHQKNRRKHLDIFEPKRKKAIDPRFQSYAGHYNSDLAMKSFDFIPKLQQAEINELKGKLKNKTKRGKLSAHQREVLTNEYNKVTSDFKRAQLMKLQQQTKKQMKQTHGQSFHLKKNAFKQEFEKKKLSNMSQADREKKLKEKQNQMRRNYQNQRRKTLNINPHKRTFPK